MRRSLGDEIKRLGILGSPFCDKGKSSSPLRENLILHSNGHNDSFNINLPVENNYPKKVCAHDFKEHETFGGTQMNIHNGGTDWKSEILESFKNPKSSLCQAVACLNLYTNHRLQLLFRIVLLYLDVILQTRPHCTMMLPV